MSSADLNALFGGGVELGRDVVAKAQLRFRVRPPQHPAEQAVVDRMVREYDERLDMIVGEVADVLHRADPRRSHDQPLILTAGLPAEPVSKAVAHAPFRPGSRGGKWYRDSRGNIRYGDPPEGRYMGNAPDTSPAPHLGHLQPRQFMGAFGNDPGLTGYLLEHGGEHGFSDGELRFLEAWYGVGEEGGALFDAFLECTQLTRDDLKRDTTNLQFGSQGLTYEEAVFEFFAAQGSLFMGEEPTTPEDVEEWHRILNEEIKPLLDGVFIKYEEAKEDDELQQRFSSEPDRQRRRFYDAARRCEEDTRGVADVITGDWDPTRQAVVVVAGLHALGLFVRPARAERSAYIHGRPHLRDAVVLDGRLLADGPGNPLLADKGKLSTLPASQLMLLHVAAELHRRWDPHTKAFSTERQAEAGSGELGSATFRAIVGKDAGWSAASGTVRSRLEELVDLMVGKLNRVNAREGTPAKHGPARKPRSGR